MTSDNDYYDDEEEEEDDDGGEAVGGEGGGGGVQKSDPLLLPPLGQVRTSQRSWMPNVESHQQPLGRQQGIWQERCAKVIVFVGWGSKHNDHDSNRESDVIRDGIN